MFSKILIANRGEIACRVIQSAKKMGVRTVAIYSEVDRKSKHVSMADEAWGIGPASVNESYLNADKIIEITQKSGAEAIHPGYGFLSENPDFVDACEASGLTFIGPSAQAIRRMGFKNTAKNIMADAGIPILPGYHGENQESDYLAQRAEEIGYPVLIKAIAGGGGRGMRRVNNSEEFENCLESAKREAATSFGENRVLIEKFLKESRHIEIQVFGDNFGQVVYLFDRDCSLQRRHQKVVEEAPALGLSKKVQIAMGEAAVKAAQIIGYTGAGTVEFIMDHSKGLQADHFYFMEMNTRLQVEHPVTEFITGTDLVEWQLQIAAGASLPIKQEDLQITGHAIEVRVYAEDVDKGFLPTTGYLSHLVMPKENATQSLDVNECVRIDSGVRQGDEITPYYDTMIAKLIVHGKNRNSALSRMSAALQEFQIAGCVTNIEFLKRLINHNTFRDGNFDTGLIERELDDFIGDGAVCEEANIIAALHTLGLLEETNDIDPFASLRGWRHWSGVKWFVNLVVGGDLIEFLVDYFDGGFELEFEGKVALAKIIHCQSNQVTVKFGERIVHASFIETLAGVTVFYEGCPYNFTTPDQSDTFYASVELDPRMTAPLPGKIIVVNVVEGQIVSEGEPLIIVEAMKMEHIMSAPYDGNVTDLSVVVGDQVEEGALLLTVKEAEK